MFIEEEKMWWWFLAITKSLIFQGGHLQLSPCYFQRVGILLLISDLRDFYCIEEEKLVICMEFLEESI